MEILLNTIRVKNFNSCVFKLTFEKYMLLLFTCLEAFEELLEVQILTEMILSSRRSSHS